jgi:4-hydroxyphenylpyruvate dioxygenase-like putative hemolysin
VLQIYRIDHIGQSVPELNPQIERLEGLFGFRRPSGWRPAGEGLRFAIPGSRGQYWELHETTEPRGGLHHVGVEVPDLAAALAELAQRGLKPVAGESGAWADISLTPPEHAPGVLFRLRGPGRHGTVDPTPYEPSAEPNLGIVALDHVCQAFPDREELARWYADLAGFVPIWRTPIDEHPDMADLVMNIPGSSICWEIIMPRGEDSFIQRFLERSGAAAHHVTFEVADWDQAMAACRHHDTPTFGDNEGSTDGAAWRDAFIHPKHTGGVLVQLFWEERPGVWVRSDKIPAGASASRH